MPVRRASYGNGSLQTSRGQNVVSLLCGIPLNIGIVIAKALRGAAIDLCLAVRSFDDQGNLFHLGERVAASEYNPIDRLALDELRLVTADADGTGVAVKKQGVDELFVLPVFTIHRQAQLLVHDVFPLIGYQPDNGLAVGQQPVVGRGFEDPDETACALNAQRLAEVCHFLTFVASR